MNFHEPSTAISDSPIQVRSQEKTVWSTVKTIMIGAVLLLAAGIAVERLTGGLGLFFDNDYDHVSESQVRDRQQAYTTAVPVQLAPVSPTDMANAVASMELSSAQEKVLLAELQPRGAASEAAAPAQMNMNATPASVQQDETPLQLAWITLWDTDTDDADTVRLTSSGYSRVVTLTNHPVTFAVPIPPTGIINVTGIHDGGGGITVGVMSGSTPVPLPIMSEGQVIGIPVAIH